MELLDSTLETISPLNTLDSFSPLSPISTNSAELDLKNDAMQDAASPIPQQNDATSSIPQQKEPSRFDIELETDETASPFSTLDPNSKDHASPGEVRNLATRKEFRSANHSPSQPRAPDSDDADVDLEDPAPRPRSQDTSAITQPKSPQQTLDGCPLCQQKRRNSIRRKDMRDLEIKYSSLLAEHEKLKAAYFAATNKPWQPVESQLLNRRARKSFGSSPSSSLHVSTGFTATGAATPGSTNSQEKVKAQTKGSKIPGKKVNKIQASEKKTDTIFRLQKLATQRQAKQDQRQAKQEQAVRNGSASTLPRDKNRLGRTRTQEYRRPQFTRTLSGNQGYRSPNALDPVPTLHPLSSSYPGTIGRPSQGGLTSASASAGKGLGSGTFTSRQRSHSSGVVGSDSNNQFSHHTTTPHAQSMSLLGANSYNSNVQPFMMNFQNRLPGNSMNPMTPVQRSMDFPIHNNHPHSMGAQPLSQSWNGSYQYNAKNRPGAMLGSMWMQNNNLPTNNMQTVSSTNPMQNNNMQTNMPNNMPNSNMQSNMPNSMPNSNMQTNVPNSMPNNNVKFVSTFDDYLFTTTTSQGTANLAGPFPSLSPQLSPSSSAFSYVDTSPSSPTNSSQSSEVQIDFFGASPPLSQAGISPPLSQAGSESDANRNPRHSTRVQAQDYDFFSFSGDVVAPQIVPSKSPLNNIGQTSNSRSTPKGHSSRHPSHSSETGSPLSADSEVSEDPLLTGLIISD
jgi:hypothetical protein